MYKMKPQRRARGGSRRPVRKGGNCPSLVGGSCGRKSNHKSKFQVQIFLRNDLRWWFCIPCFLSFIIISCWLYPHNAFYYVSKKSRVSKIKVSLRINTILLLAQSKAFCTHTWYRAYVAVYENWHIYFEIHRKL